MFVYKNKIMLYNFLFSHMNSERRVCVLGLDLSLCSPGASVIEWSEAGDSGDAVSTTVALDCYFGQFDRDESTDASLDVDVQSVLKVPWSTVLGLEVDRFTLHNRTPPPSLNLLADGSAMVSQQQPLTAQTKKRKRAETKKKPPKKLGGLNPVRILRMRRVRDWVASIVTQSQRRGSTLLGVYIEGYACAATYSFELLELGGMIRGWLADRSIPFCEVAPEQLKLYFFGRGSHRSKVPMALSWTDYVGLPDLRPQIDSLKCGLRRKNQKRKYKPFLELKDVPTPFSDVVDSFALALFAWFSCRVGPGEGMAAPPKFPASQAARLAWIRKNDAKLAL